MNDRSPEGEGPLFSGSSIEEELRESEARFRRLSDATSEGIAVHERGIILEANQAMADMFGYQVSELIGMSALDLHPPEIRTIIAERILARRDEPHEDVALRKDGTTFLAEIAATDLPFHGRAARVTRINDVTERKRAQDSLRRREAILEAVAFAADRFFKAETWEHGMKEVLERLGEATGVSRVYVFENHLAADGVRLLHSYRHEWCAGGIVPQIDNPRLYDEPYDYAWSDWRRTLEAGGVVLARTEEMGQPARGILEEQSILSIAMVPVFVGEEWWGSMGLDECAVEREWSAGELDALRAAANILGGVIGRQRSERERQEAEEKYRALVEQLPAIVYLAEFGPEGAWLYVSPRIEQILGFTPEEWLVHPHPFASFCHPDDLEKAWAQEQRARETGDTFRTEYRMYTRDGELRWILDESTVVRDAEGKPLFLQGIMYDYTELRAAQEERRIAEERWGTLVEQIPAAVYMEDLAPDTRTRVGGSYMSPGIGTISGYAPEEWLDRAFYWDHIVHPEDRGWLEEAAEASNLAGTPRAAEYRIVCRSGEVRWVRDEATLVHGEALGAKFWHGLVSDITERKTADAERRRVQARLVAAQEEERRRISESIHEDQIQKMSAVGLRLRTFSRNLDGKALEDLEALQRTVETTIESLRGLLMELRPPILDQAGLAAALNQYLLAAEAGSGLEYRLEGQMDEPSPETRAIAYRIALEALHEARRHAGVSRIVVSLASRDGGVLIGVADDGERSEPGEAEELGLCAMRERADLAGGWLEVRRDDPQWSRVEFWIPVEGRSDPIG